MTAMLRFLPLGLLIVACNLLAAPTTTAPAATATSNPFSEAVIEQKLPVGVRVVTNAPAKVDLKRPTLLILYALPNGNTIEQTVGCGQAPGLDWHYYIQHIGAQTRRLREVLPQQNIVVAYLEAEGKSWPAWRKAHADPKLIRQIVDDLTKKYPGARVVLVAHSGGGSFITGYINADKAIDPKIERIAYLDANYSYDDENDHHGDKLLAWLRADKSHQLEVICYDDRNITFQGKPVVGPTGGTYRATHRMMDRFAKEGPDFVKPFDNKNVVEIYRACNDQAEFMIHRNPDNKILHTVLVGDMSGFLQAMARGTPAEKQWGTFGGPITYAKWIQPPPRMATTTTTQATTTTAPASQPKPFDLAFAFPARPKTAAGGHDVMKRVGTLARDAREEQLVKEVLAGNVPDFLRKGVVIPAQAGDHKIAYVAAVDYLAVGSDDDFVRIPLTPMSAQKIADALKCSLPTKKMVNDIYNNAVVKLAPQPLTEAREASGTFVQHSDLIESKRPKEQTGELVAGVKKDVVISNRLTEKPNRVLIYGWHKATNQPIQPLTNIHNSTYIDYSHGIRLIKEEVLVDDKPMKLQDVMQDETLSPLVSDEGPLGVVRY
jgi:pimeloyl-ACP methyl ester carboxylesterase